MDFSFSEEQLALRDLARGILEQELVPERLKAAETGGAGFDAALWSKLAEANLLGLAVPEAQGGMGYGLLELCVLLQELGRAVAPVPVQEALLLAGLPIARFGTLEQQGRWLAPLAAGRALLSGALPEFGPDDLPRAALRARRAGADFVLDGTLARVPAAERALRIVAPAETAEGIGLFLVPPSGAGVRLTTCQTSRREPQSDVALAGVRLGAEERLGGERVLSAAELASLRDAALAGVCATQLGVSERALEITTRHLRERVQFGAPIGSFPAVQQRAADCYIDLEAMRWTTWRAVWRLSRGEPARREAAVAKFWAAEGGARIAAAAQHLHGGLGVDVDYPIHRYFLWAKALELRFGAATPQLARLGREMARSGPRELA